MKHIHRYQRIKLGKNYVVFKCDLPDCRHYLRPELVKDKISICNRCNEPFILDIAAMQLSKPHCLSCTKRKSKTHGAIRDLLENIM